MKKIPLTIQEIGKILDGNPFYNTLTRYKIPHGHMNCYRNSETNDDENVIYDCWIDEIGVGSVSKEDLESMTFEEIVKKYDFPKID